MDVGINITKAATFKSFLHLSYKNTQLLFLTVFFDIFMKQTLTNDFWGLHKNMNCAFPLIFGYVERRLGERAKINFKIYDVTNWATNNV